MAVTVYKTIQGDMWDTISYRLYGTGDYMHRLMEANPAIADVWVFGGGVIVVVPDIVVDGAGVKLPPWKRGTGKMVLTPSEDVVIHRYVGDYYTGNDVPEEPDTPVQEGYVSLTSSDGTVTYADSAISLLEEGAMLTVSGPFTIASDGTTVTIRRVYGR